MDDANTWETYELPRLSDAPPDDMFTPLDQQLANVVEWNQTRRWGFTPEEFAAIDITPRTYDNPLVVDLIAVYLKGKGDLDAVRHTADDLWLLAALQQPNSWCWCPVRLAGRLSGDGSAVLPALPTAVPDLDPISSDAQPHQS